MTYIPQKLRRQIEQDAGHRYGFCLSDETLSGIPLSVEHLIPETLGGKTVRENLWLTCRPCNEYKATLTHGLDAETGETVPLFNPRIQNWQEHFAWHDDGVQLVGKTAIGRATVTTVTALRLNRPLLMKARKRWAFAGWHPPK